MLIAVNGVFVGLCILIDWLRSRKVKP